ncbi:pilus assembly protein TadG-related protein [Roseiarcaceae bacterium H3SJ34-1]|uniref:TadE/TadG family type IV pilus assembly protein n=1 Tax=Terripilifer ovatus TaxID=3032367 RepID=UPI003AB9749C|nr:pilus assembly protein TadG-related protein [Roseiarcaceae bacterium H3SJ34-1]
MHPRHRLPHIGPLQEFAGDRRANVAIIFSLCMLTIMLLIGATVDYSRALTLRTKMNVAADSAALAAVSESINGNLAKPNKSQVRGFFNAFSADFPGVTFPTIDVKSTTTATSISTTVSYTANVPTTFMQIAGLKSISIHGSATAAANKPKYVDFYLLLDNSPSMGLGATATDITKLQALTPDNCAFACHMHTFDSQGRITGNSTTDYYTIAKKGGVQTRIDVLRTATKNLTDSAVAATQMPNQFRMGIYTFSDILQVISSPLTNLTTGSPNVKSLADNIDLAYAYYDQRDTQTSFETALTTMNDIMPSPGDGTKQIAPSAFLFIVTDGVQDQPVMSASGKGDVADAIAPGSTYVDPGVEVRPNLYSNAVGNVSSKRLISVLTTSYCDIIKQKNIRIAVLYTPYLPVTSNAFYNQWVAPISTQIPVRLQACASPGFYFQITPTQGINEAMQAMFQAALSQTRLTN